MGTFKVIHHSDEVLNSMNEWCIEHHGKSGLTEAVKNSKVTAATITTLYCLGIYMDTTVFFSALHAGMREAVVVFHLRTHSSWRVPPGWELSGTGRQVPLEIHAGTDGALGKAPCHFPNSCIHE